MPAPEMRSGGGLRGLRYEGDNRFSHRAVRSRFFRAPGGGFVVAACVPTSSAPCDEAEDAAVSGFIHRIHPHLPEAFAAKIIDILGEPE
jgi:hypothetical protein